MITTAIAIFTTTITTTTITTTTTYFSTPQNNVYKRLSRAEDFFSTAQVKKKQKQKSAIEWKTIDGKVKITGWEIISTEEKIPSQKGKCLEGFTKSWSEP